MKRGYYVYDYDAYWGVGIVATSAKEAKKLGYEELQDVEWINIRCTWQRGVNVHDLEIGVIHDLKEGLRRGFFGILEDCICDSCGEESLLHCYNGQALCDACIEREEK